MRLGESTTPKRLPQQVQWKWVEKSVDTNYIDNTRFYVGIEIPFENPRGGLKFVCGEFANLEA